MTSFQALYPSPGPWLHTPQRFTGFCVLSELQQFYATQSRLPDSRVVLCFGEEFPDTAPLRSKLILVQVRAGSVCLCPGILALIYRVQLYPRVRRDSEGWVLCLRDHCRGWEWDHIGLSSPLQWLPMLGLSSSVFPSSSLCSLLLSLPPFFHSFLFRKFPLVQWP